jgi:hypothetical protein
MYLLSEGVTFSSVHLSCIKPHSRSNLDFSFWTNRQKIRTPEQFSTTAKELYSTVLTATHLSKGVIMGKLKGKVAAITGGSSGLEKLNVPRP